MQAGADVSTNSQRRASAMVRSAAAGRRRRPAAAECLEVVVVGAPDVLDQLVGQRRVPPQPGEPPPVPGPASPPRRGRRAPRGPGRARCAASGTPRPPRSARPQQVVAGEDRHRAFDLGRGARDGPGRRGGEGPGEDGDPAQHGPARRLEPVEAPREGVAQRVLPVGQAAGVGREVERAVDQVEQLADRHRAEEPATSSSARGRPSTRRATRPAPGLRRRAMRRGQRRGAAAVGEPLGEQPYGRGGPHGAEGHPPGRPWPAAEQHHPFADDRQRRARGHDEPDPGAAGEDGRRASAADPAPTRPRRRARRRRWSAGPARAPPPRRRPRAARPVVTATPAASSRGVARRAQTARRARRRGPVASAAPTSASSRDFPTPPGPVTVTSRRPSVRAPSTGSHLGLATRPSATPGPAGARPGWPRTGSGRCGRGRPGRRYRRPSAGLREDAGVHRGRPPARVRPRAPRAGSAQRA